MSLRLLLEKNGLDLSDLFYERCEVFVKELSNYNKTHNITGAKTKEAIYQNILDSIYPISLLKGYTSFLDIGTGAGFPGLILAFESDARVVLCEPLKKRAAFLFYIKTLLKLSHVKVESKRVEDVRSEPFELITSRAVTKTKMLITLCKHLMDERTTLLFYKGSNVVDELDDAMDYTLTHRENRKYLLIKGTLS